jgi:hypothetical protein
MIKKLTFLAGLLIAVGANAAITLDGLTLHDDGSIFYEGQRLYLAHQTPEYFPTAQNSESCKALPGFPKTTEDGAEFKGLFSVAGGTFELTETIHRDGVGAFDVCIDAVAREAVPTARLCMQISLTTAEYAGHPLWLNGEKMLLPESFSEVDLASAPAGASLGLRKSDGNTNLQISCEKGALGIQDCRRWQIPQFAVMFLASPSNGNMTKSRISYRLQSLSANSFPVNIRSVVNRGFKDEFADDGKGGWTDQGQSNDLSMFPCGQEVKWAGIRFDLIDPEQNNGNGCIVFMPGQKNSVEIPVGGKVLQHLNFLHAFAWVMGAPNAQVGTIRVVFSDGTETQIPVCNSQDGADWWSPVPCSNGRIGWSATNRSATVALFIASWELQTKPVEKLILSSNPEHAWMIVAISGSDAEPSPAFAAPLQKITESDIWRKMEFPREVIPGSILDFSETILDAPAGKYGRAETRENGIFSFEKRPDIPIRLMGVNLCFGANMPDHELAEIVAQRFAAYGINAVRFHHNDCVLAGGADNAELNPDVMDRFDYFFACLKKRGIYMISDFAATRYIPANAVEGISDALPVNLVKVLTILHDGVRNNQKKLIKNWLTHVNPYTGIAWKDDPAFIGATLTNENNLDYWINVTNSKLIAEILDKKLAAFRATSPECDKDELYLRFTAAAQKEYFEDMRNFVRSLDCDLPLTDRNMGTTVFDTFCRANYDYVDNHMYIDHPTGDVPVRVGNNTVIPTLGGGLAELAPGRLLDRGFTVTEYNWVFPNRYRAESGVLTAAYGALQGWNGLYRFTYAHPIEALKEQSIMIMFDCNSDPINLFSDRIGALLFSRGDIAEAKEKVSIALTYANGAHLDPYPKTVRGLLSVCRVGSLPEEKEKAMLTESMPLQDGQFDINDPQLPEKLQAAGTFGAKGIYRFEDKFTRSSTGELELDGKAGTFKAVSPRTEVLIRNSPGYLNGQFMTVKTHFQNSVLCVSAMDGKTLAESKRLVLIHLTNALNHNSVFSDSEFSVYLERGELPLVVRYGNADVQLATNGKTFKVYAVAVDGKRLGEVPTVMNGNTLTFSADNFAFPGQVVFAYELLMAD